VSITNTLAKLTFSGIAIIGLSNVGFSQEPTDCGYENGVQRYCGKNLLWIFDKNSYAMDGNHFFGFAPSDAQWEYVSKGWDGTSCEQNEAGVFVAAPNITIKEAESERYQRINFSIPITALMETSKLLPADGSTILSYELQANNKTIIGPFMFTFSGWNLEDSRRFASTTRELTGSGPIKNEVLHNVKVVISNLIQKVDPSKDYRCYRFDLVLGKGRIELMQ
jgi:hypothetical protein